MRSHLTNTSCAHRIGGRIHNDGYEARKAPPSRLKKSDLPISLLRPHAWEPTPQPRPHTAAIDHATLANGTSVRARASEGGPFLVPRCRRPPSLPLVAGVAAAGPSLRAYAAVAGGLPRSSSAPRRPPTPAFPPPPPPLSNASAVSEGCVIYRCRVRSRLRCGLPGVRSE